MALTGLSETGVETVGEIGGGLAVIDLARLAPEDIRAVLPLAIACFLLAYVESISVVRSFALKHAYATDADREMLALGAANLAAGLGQGFPVGGGMSQSAVNEKGGARSPVSLLVAALAIAAVALFFTGFFRNLPEPVLAAVVLMAIKGLVDIGELRHLYRVSRLEFHVALVAAMGVLLFGVLNGVLLAAIAAVGEARRPPPHRRAGPRARHGRVQRHRIRATNARPAPSSHASRALSSTSTPSMCAAS